MPLYMDMHPGADLPAEMRDLVEHRIRSGQPDAFGVVDRGIILDTEAGRTYCLLDAPDPEAVVQHHRAFDVPLDPGSVHRADAILK